MTRFAEVIDNIILRDPNDIYNRVYVVSAYGGVTNDLLENKKTGHPGIYKIFVDQGDYPAAMAELKKRLCEMNRRYVDIGLDLAVADRFLSERIDSSVNVLKSIQEVLSSGYVNRREMLLAAREILASIGEMQSAYNSADILRHRGYRTNFVDLSGWGDAREFTIDQRIKDTFKSIDPSKSICFATGYAKGTEGIMREFDRGYSEVTFSKIAVILKPAEAIIHKEFHLCSGDPGVVGEKNAKPVCFTNFDVADQLADVGMEAIHPKASKPLELNRIPIRVKNAFDPDHPGTLITKDYIRPESKTEVVAGTEKVTYVEVHDPKMVGEVGFDLKIMQVLADHGASYVSKVTNANTIGIVLADKDVDDALIADLKSKFEMVTVEKVALVCAIGSNIARPGVLALAAGALAEAKINVLAVSQAARQTNMQFVVVRQCCRDAQRALHHALCENGN
jgi:aspartate kinase